jgi:23S rRNA pseudouridine955/2504/2580 synthase/23S rRNA pseudouridine1911/1915/1917 synthase
MRQLPPQLVAETEDYIAINKPSGMLTLPDRHDAEKSSLKGWVLERYPEAMVVHRLDKDTSGLLLFARHPAAHQYLSQLFETRQIRKIYKGLVTGTPLESKGSIEAPIAEHPAKNGSMIVHAKGKNSLTSFVVEKSWKSISLLTFEPHTGRTHQIRVHARHIGHPLLCDSLYGDGKPVLLSAFKKKFKLSKNEEAEKPILNRLALHSYALMFTDRAGNEVSLTAPLHKDMAALMAQLDKINRYI